MRGPASETPGRQLQRRGDVILSRDMNAAGQTYLRLQRPHLLQARGDRDIRGAAGEVGGLAVPNDPSGSERAYPVPISALRPLMLRRPDPGLGQNALLP
jgi:hypothetical protein